ncbi:type VI secretion system protein TssL, long form [Fulvimarina sp. MAC8]|uniref:type VI secretion system protein TssL, long form n=1 Tax=Fulvimarina sp. MAC8 TaxID=3162874 RepID=UPI0032EFD2E4
MSADTPMQNEESLKEGEDGESEDAGVFDDFENILRRRSGSPEASSADKVASWSTAELLRNFRLGGEEVPPIVASAAPLINLAHELSQRSTAPDIEQMRPVVVDAVRRYERDLASARISPERARAAHYVVCATIDDVILSKPWAERITWARSGLVSTFHMDVTGGERVFDLLDHFHQSPGANKDLLLLIYLCISLAFAGRTRVSPRGALELERIRESLYRTLLGQYGVFERELSPHWRGVNARHKPLRTLTVLWTLLAALLLALGLGYFLFTTWLAESSDTTFSRLAELPPNEAPSLAPVVVAPVEQPSEPDPKPQVAPPPPPKPVAPPEKPENQQRIEDLMAFLQPEVEKGLVTLSDAKGNLRVRIRNAGLFDVGSAEIAEGFEGLLSRIGGALASEDFKATVIGYTDNVPIRTVQFPSNWDLSKARAEAVGEILVRFTGEGVVTTEGRADSDPIASNETPEGREKNRRTEIIVATDAPEVLRELGLEADDRTEAPLPETSEGSDRP